MTEKIIDFDTAKLAKEKGFEVNCLHFYTKLNSKMFRIDEHGRTYTIKNTTKKLYKCGEEAALNIESVYLAPTQSLLQKWLRDNYNIDIQVLIVKPGYKEYKVEIYRIEENNPHYLHTFIRDGDYVKFFLLYEDALEAGLKESLKII